MASSYTYMGADGSVMRNNGDGTPDTVVTSAADAANTAASNSQYNADIASANASYAPLIQAQEQYNKQFEAGSGVEGLVSGRTRYAPQVQTGIMAGVVNEGIQAINKILVSKNSAIAAAGAARDARDAKALEAAMQAKKDAAAATYKAAQDAKENAIKAAKAIQDKQKSDQEDLDAKAKIVAGNLAGITDAVKRNAYIDSYAKTNNLDPVNLRGSINNVIDDKNKTLDTAIYGIAKEFPNAVTTEDLVGRNIASIISKISKTPEYLLANAQKRATLAKTIADAKKAENDMSGGAGSLAVAYSWAMTGKEPAGLQGLNRDVNFELAKQYAKENISNGAIVSKDSGFLIPASDLSAVNELAVSASQTFLKASSEITDFLKTHSTYPGGRAVAVVGKLIALTDAEIIKFNALRDNLTAAFVQSVSGVAVNEKEYERLTKLIPNSSEWNKYAITKWDVFMDQTKRKTTSILDQRNATIKGVDLRTESDVKSDIQKAKKSANLKTGQRLIQDSNGQLQVLDSGDPLLEGDIEL